MTSCLSLPRAVCWKRSKLFPAARHVKLLLLHVACQSSFVWQSWSLSGIDQNIAHWTFRWHNLITGKTPQKVHFPFFSKVKFWRVVRTFSTPPRQPLYQFGWNLARLLLDSSSAKLCLRIFIPLFVVKLDLFSTGSANLFVFSDFSLLIKEEQTHLPKIWDTVF